jgi:hypothetical protein
MLQRNMTVLRRHLSTFAMLWVLLQIAGTSAPLTLLASGGLAEELCTCPSADHGATCPMHHPQGSTSERDDRDGHCKLQNGCAPSDVALLSLAGGAGVPSCVLTYAPAAQSSAQAAVMAPSRLSRAHTPDSPPPRS